VLCSKSGTADDFFSWLVAGATTRLVELLEKIGIEVTVVILDLSESWSRLRAESVEVDNILSVFV
jgi:hypothetical protein